jgi:hypothetical protein
MSQVKKLESAVKALPKKDFEAFKRWLLEFDYERWTKQIEQNSHDDDSPIMKLAKQALNEHKAGKSKKL